MAKVLNFLAQSARPVATANASETKDSSGYRDMSITIPVTAVAGAGATLDLKVQHSVDGVTWADLFIVPQITAAGVFEYDVKKTFQPKLQTVHTIAGAGAIFTFKCFGYLKNREAV